MPLHRTSWRQQRPEKIASVHGRDQRDSAAGGENKIKRSQEDDEKGRNTCFVELGTALMGVTRAQSTEINDVRKQVDVC